MSRLAGSLSAAAVLAALAAGYLLAGPVGLAAMAVVAGLLGLLAGWARLPRPKRRRGGRPAAPAQIRAADFSSYHDIRHRLSWSRVSRRHFDLTTRPMLARLLAATLTDRRRIDMATTPERARTLVGEPVWELLDPARPAENDGDVPGIDRATIERIIDTLESL